jgi:hypothetical protein
VIDETDNQIMRGGQFVRDLKVEYNGRIAGVLARALNGATNVKTEGNLVKYAIRF